MQVSAPVSHPRLLLSQSFTAVVIQAGERFSCISPNPARQLTPSSGTLAGCRASAQRTSNAGVTSAAVIFACSHCFAGCLARGNRQRYPRNAAQRFSGRGDRSGGLQRVVGRVRSRSRLLIDL